MENTLPNVSKEAVENVFNQVKDNLNDIYKKRKITAIFQKLVWGLSVVFIITIIILAMISRKAGDSLSNYHQYSHNFYYYLIPIIGLIIIINFCTKYFISNMSKYKDIETRTMSFMVKTLFPNFSFGLSSKTAFKEIRGSKIFSYADEDTLHYVYGCMNGKIENVDINIADIGISEKKIAQNIADNTGFTMLQYFYKNLFTSKTADNTIYTFRGMFCWASFNKKLSGSTVIIPNTAGDKFDRTTSFSFKNEERILLEDIRFEKEFSVYGTDQVEARYVLTSTLMEKIVELKNKFGRNIMLSFKDDKMFLAVHNPNGLFSFPQGKIDTIEVINEIVDDVNTALSVIDDFRLNRHKLN